MSITTSQRLVGAVPTVCTLLVLAAVGWWGHHTGWSAAPLASARAEDAAHEDWCNEHGVPESTCLWCRKPLAKAMIAKEPAAYRAKDEEVRFAQVASEAVLAKVGITTAKAEMSEIEPTLTAPAETIYDQTRVTRLGGRLAGTVRTVLKRLGDSVSAGEVVALIESAEVGKAKSDLMRALAEQATAEAAATRAKASLAGGFRTAAEAQEAEARLRAARVGVFDAEQSLLNFGLPIVDADLAAAEPAALAARLRTLGLPTSLAGEARSANLLPIAAPQDGVITEIHAVPGETVDANTVLAVIADPSTLWLTMSIPADEAARLSAGRTVRFTAAGGTPTTATVSVISPAADEATRLVTVRAAIDNRSAGLRAHQVGTAVIELGEAIKAVVLPPEALQYDGATAYVFVRRSPTVFRGLAVPVLSRTPAGVAVGRLMPGDEVAMTGTAMLKGNLFQDKFGADDD